VLPLQDVDKERLRQQRESTPTGNVELYRQRRGPRGGLLLRPPGRHVVALDDRKNMWRL